MTIESHFSATYGEARERFLDGAREAGAELASYRNPVGLGPDGEDLCTDVARIGPADARRIYLTLSATHGAEGYCGSGIQVGHLREGLLQALPPDTAAVFVHAINPHGFAWGRRVTEDNVDLNRNFQDFSQPLPENPAYAEVHPWLLPADWDGLARAEAEAAIARYVSSRGAFAFQVAVTGGQYQFADGLFYGGRAPTWSNGILRRIIEEHLPRNLRRLVVIDYHTGLGPWGHGEPISVSATDGPRYAACRAAFGPELTNPADGNSTSAPVTGTLLGVFDQLPDTTEVLPVVLEYGTVPVPPLLEALRGDHWLHSRADLSHPLATALKARMRAAFYQEHPAWKTAVFGRAADFTLRAFRALAAPLQ